MRWTRGIGSRWLSAVLAAGLAGGCATTMPPTAQLVDARQAYANASVGTAPHYAPWALLDARRALDVAESEYANNASLAVQQHYAYLALRQAQIASATGDAAAAQRAGAAQQAYAEAQARDAQAKLDQAQQEIAQRDAELQAERQARDADQASRDQLLRERDAALAELRELAAIQETERGLVITMGGSLLFRTDEAELLPLAQERLGKIAIALQHLGPDQSLVIEGHTDSRGTPDFNRRLSAARAEAVRAYLVSRGVSPDRVVAVGKGEDDPVASNDSAEGRANNRRVEIVVSRPPVATTGTPVNPY